MWMSNHVSFEKVSRLDVRKPIRRITPFSYSWRKHRVSGVGRYSVLSGTIGMVRYLARYQVTML